MRGFGRTLLWRAAGTTLMPAALGASLRNWRSSGPPWASARAAAVFFAALLAAAALFAAIGLRSGGLLVLYRPQGRIIAPADNQDFGWIERAIAQCEAEAARSADTLYFLVIPVVTIDGNP